MCLFSEAGQQTWSDKSSSEPRLSLSDVADSVFGFTLCFDISGGDEWPEDVFGGDVDECFFSGLRTARYAARTLRRRVELCF